jgi:nitrate reductase gamma subunit
MADIEANPYAGPRSTDSAPPPSAEDANVSVKALRLAGTILTFFACMKAFGLATSISAMLARLGSTELGLSWSVLTALVPSAVGFAIPLVLGVALLFGKARYRNVAWLYADIITVWGLIGSVAWLSLGRATMPRLYLAAVCSEKLLLAVAVSLLLVGRPKPVRVAAGALLGALYVLNVFGMGWFLTP